MHTGRMTAQARDKQLRNAAVAAAAMLLSQLALAFGNLLFRKRLGTWGMGLACMALGCAFWLNWIAWRVRSPAGDRGLRNYWIFCAVLAALSALDDCGDGVWAMLAVVSTPMASLAAVSSLLPGTITYRAVCGLSAAFSLAQAFYDQGLLRRHRAERENT